MDSTGLMEDSIMTENERKGTEMAVGASKAALGCIDGCGTWIFKAVLILGLLGMLLKSCGIMD